MQQAIRPTKRIPVSAAMLAEAECTRAPTKPEDRIILAVRVYSMANGELVREWPYVGSKEAIDLWRKWELQRTGFRVITDYAENVDSDKEYAT